MMKSTVSLTSTAFDEGPSVSLGTSSTLPRKIVVCQFDTSLRQKIYIVNGYKPRSASTLLTAGSTIVDPVS